MQIHIERTRDSPPVASSDLLLIFSSYLNNMLIILSNITNFNVHLEKYHHTNNKEVSLTYTDIQVRR